MEQKLKQYVLLGRYYVSKKFIVLVLSILALLPPLFVKVITPVWEQYFGAERLYLNSDKLMEYVGVAEIYNLNNRRVYKGGVNMGKFEGRGILYAVDDKILYEGEFLESAFHGQGKLYDMDGKKKYEGSFVQDLYEGYGGLYENGDIEYLGEFVAGAYSGEGMEYQDSSVVYKGGFKNGERCGFGIIYKDDKTEYAGYFDNGMYEGEGKLYNEQNILIYEGLFHRGEYDGEGKQYNEIGRLLYNGAHTNGQKNGFGEYYGQTGSLIYKGLFMQDEIDYISWLGASRDKVMEGFTGRFNRATSDGTNSGTESDAESDVAQGKPDRGTQHEFEQKSYMAVSFERMSNVFIFESGQDSENVDAICLFGEQKTQGIVNAKPPTDVKPSREEYSALPDYFDVIVDSKYFSETFPEIPARERLYRRTYPLTDDTQISSWALTDKTNIMFHVIEYIWMQNDAPDPSIDPNDPNQPVKPPIGPKDPTQPVRPTK